MWAAIGIHAIDLRLLYRFKHIHGFKHNRLLGVSDRLWGIKKQGLQAYYVEL